MSELDEKLNTLLSDPDSMARIMHLAQNLSAPAAEAAPSPAAPPPEPAGGSGAAAGVGDLLGGLDPKLIARYLPLLQKFGATNTDTQRLLSALRPFLKEEKQEKIDRAAKLAKLFILAKEFFKNWEG